MTAVTHLPTLRDVIDNLARFFRIDTAQLVGRALQVVVIWISAWLAMWVIRAMARRIVASVHAGEGTLTLREKRGQTIAQLLRSVGGVVVVLLAMLLTLNTFIQITPILAGAGILGLAISFGAQSLVKDVLSGFFILLENQFAVGDVIEAGGKSGSVERMTLRVVQLRDLQGVLHTIPNGQITVVSNKTRGWSRAVLEIAVAYGADIDRTLTVFADEAARLAADPAWRPRLEGEPVVAGVESLADSGVVIRTMIQTVPGAQWETAREFRRRIKNRLDAEGIEIPFPQRTMHLRLDDERLGGLTGAASRALGGSA